MNYDIPFDMGDQASCKTQIVRIFSDVSSKFIHSIFLLLNHFINVHILLQFKKK